MDTRKEALRYLGYKGEPDIQTVALLDKAQKELEAAAVPKYCWRVFRKTDCSNILIGNDIKKHLIDSEEIILFAATLGPAADRLIRAAEISNMAYAVVLDAYASALIEEYCDNCEKEMNKKTGGCYTFRFSAGYGDYPISVQGDFIRMLSADKLIGLTSTDSHILVPRKSVTAVIGIADKPQSGMSSKCDSCNMNNTCRFRKDGIDCGR